LNSPPQKICLVTPGHVSSTPRLIKEADALAEAGYDVRVVAARHYRPNDPLDASVIGRARWRCVRVEASGRMRIRLWSIVRRLGQAAASRMREPGNRLCAIAQDPVSLRLLAAAAAEKSDLYIGHCLGGLPAVALSALRHGTRYGFDIEDYHDGETAQAMGSPVLAKTARLLQSRLLPGASYLTAASPLIAAEYAKAYGVRAETVLNVFPRSEAPAGPVSPPPISRDAPAVLYWFSQTAGSDRGLEEMLRVVSKMRTPAVMHLRCFVSEGYRGDLARLASDLGVRHPPRFLPPANPREMARLAAGAHAGICAERDVVPNRDLCLTNKIFTYMIAGIPTLLAPTRAHLELAPKLGSAVRVLPLDDALRSAQIVDSLLENPGEQLEARATAWRLAQTRYCWDVEKQVLLASVEAALRMPQ
jgi:hypothetical protein